MNKLAVTTFVLATSLTGVAAAKGGFAGPIAPQPSPTKLDPKSQPVQDPKLLDAVFNTEIGKKFVETVKSEEPIIDTLDPGPRCKDIDAGVEFNVPLYSTDIAGFAVGLGVGGSLGIRAEPTRLYAKAGFGPTLDILGDITKPLELTFEASTNNQGQSSVDMKLMAFTYQLDSYNIANTSSPIDYLVWPSWTLPGPLSNPIGASYDCTDWALVGALLDTCSMSWHTTPLAASVAGGIAFRLSSTRGLEAHALLVGRAYSNVTVEGTAGGTFYNPLTGKDKTISTTVTGTGAINFINGTFIANAQLVPHNSHWLAYADSYIDLEDVFGAKVSAHIDLSSVGHSPLDFEAYERDPWSFNNVQSYSCTFDRAWK